MDMAEDFLTASSKFLFKYNFLSIRYSPALDGDPAAGAAAAAAGAAPPPAGTVASFSLPMNHNNHLVKRH